MKSPTLALCMIVKNEEKNIQNCINSVKPYVSEFRIIDTGSTDKTVEKIKELGIEPIRISPATNPDCYLKIENQYYLNFSQARNFSFKDVQSEWIMWLDGDDIVSGANDIPQALYIAQEKEMTALDVTYLYQVDKKGNVRVSHPKMRFVRNGYYQWEHKPHVWVVHENLYIKPQYKEKGSHVPSIKIIHTADDKDRSDSGIRNLVLLLWMSEQEELKTDPKLMFLIAREAFGNNRYDLAEQFSARAFNSEINDGDKMLLYINLAYICESRDDYLSALDCSMNAIKVRPDHPIGYIFAAKFLTLMGKYSEALQFINDAKKRDISDFDSTVQVPADLIRLASYVASECNDNLGNYEQSIKDMEAYMPYATEEEIELINHEIDTLKNKIEQKKAKDAFVVLANVELITQAEKSKSKKIKFDTETFETLIDILPKHLHTSREVLNLKRTVGLNKKHTNHIAIYCSLNFEPWDPETIIKKGGGGSETAVIELASRFAKAGYEVVVYANPVKPGTVFEGVKYEYASEINFADEFDIFISWRNPWILKTVDIKANKLYLWLQDIMQPFDYTEALVGRVDKIIVLSSYHRWTSPHVKESKFYYTTNGINLKLIEEVEKEMGNVKREPGYCIYASSADRGLDPLVQMWPDVKKSVKHARLTWFYGWNSWNVLRKDKDAAKFKKRLIKQMAKAKILEGGRIGKKELYKEYLKAQFLTYPLIGPAETSCITVMEAQALGVIPITTGITALEETQQFGLKIPMEVYKDTLIRSLESKDNTEEYREQMKKWARETFSWDRVAANWIKDLFYGEIKVDK